VRDGVAVELVNRRSFEEVREALRQSERAAESPKAAH
jgi:hypothetical protein